MPHMITDSGSMKWRVSSFLGLGGLRCPPNAARVCAGVCKASHGAIGFRDIPGRPMFWPRASILILSPIKTTRS